MSSELPAGADQQRRLHKWPPGAIEQERFRANPLYELVLLDRLSPAERELLGELADEDDLYGVLRPRTGSGLDLRSVSSDTALLVLTLAEPGRLPTYLLARLGEDLAPTIGRLVLDGVLEIEYADKFVCGARAVGLVSRRSDAGRGRIRALSTAALRYGQELAGVAAPLLARRLYFYGRLPVSPALAQRLPDAPSVAAHLGIAPGGSARAALDAGWHTRASTAGERAYWLIWQTRLRGSGGGDRSGGGYKLYVSPALDALETVVSTVAGSLVGVRGVLAFKVGAGLDGICRPDKLVVYFDRLDDLQEGAARLRDELAGCPPHGVPFTAAITHDGLLSWGADPPAAIANGIEHGSWRMWVTERLAEYLVVARDGSPSEVEPWQFALERLRLCGIDTDTWVPASGMWPQVLASA